MSRTLTLSLVLRQPSTDPLTSDELAEHLRNSLASGLFTSDFDLSIEADSYDPPAPRQMNMFDKEGK